ncbi:MAG: phage terminase large subunit [Halobacteria archaeon]
MSASSKTVEHQFKPNPGAQSEFFSATNRQLLYSGSFAAGKSRAGCEKGYMLNLKYPGNRGLIVRKALADVKTSTIKQSLLEDVIPDSHIVDHNKGDCEIKHLTGEVDPTGEPVLGEIHYYGLNSGEKTSSDDLPRKIGSTEFGWIFVDEGTELSEGEWSQLVGRLRYNRHQQNGYVYRIPIQQIFTATNPDSPNHWMHDYFGLDGSHHPNREFWKANLDDNKQNIPDEYIKDLKSSLSGRYYERYIEGEWVGAEGMVYDNFDPDKHLVDPHELNNLFDISDQADRRWEHHGREEYERDAADASHYVTPPDNWRIYRAIDFGYRNPFVCQYWARSPDDELVLFREIYKTEKTVPDLAPQIQRMTPTGANLAMTVADHDAESHENLQSEGISTINADKDVEPGIQSVKQRLSLDDRARPSLYIMRGARCHAPSNKLILDKKPLKTVDEIYDYKWKEDEEEPVKEDDHGMDAMRYLVYKIDGGQQVSLDEMREWEDLFNG